MRVRMLILIAGTLTLMAGCPTTTPFVNDPIAFAVVFAESTPSQFREGTSTSGMEFNSTCQAFFPDQPSHTLTIEASTALTVQVSGDPGVTVRLLAGQSNFCATPDNPLERFFTRGDLEVYVGTDAADSDVAYRIDFVR